jgi:hypothetical protein
MVLAESVQPVLSVRALGGVAYTAVRPFQGTGLSSVSSQQDMWRSASCSRAACSFSVRVMFALGRCLPQE